MKLLVTDIEFDFEESQNTLESYDLKENLSVYGQGINLKLGMIARVNQYTNLGLSLQSPTLFNIEETFYTEIVTYTDSNRYNWSSPYNYFEYELLTPAKIIFSGGSGVINRPDLGHAQVAKSFYKKMGLLENKIIYENNSRNTYENILFSKQIAKPQKDQKWLLITSASHMKRALLIGSKHNWHLIPYAVDFQTMKKLKFIPNLNFLSNLNAFQKGSHEWLGLITYYLMDRTNKIF